MTAPCKARMAAGNTCRDHAPSNMYTAAFDATRDRGACASANEGDAIQQQAGIGARDCNSPSTIQCCCEGRAQVVDTVGCAHPTSASARAIHKVVDEPLYISGRLSPSPEDQRSDFTITSQLGFDWPDAACRGVRPNTV